MDRLSKSSKCQKNIRPNSPCCQWKYFIVQAFPGNKNKKTSYTFTTDKTADILEGVRVENEGNTTIIYKLTYVKLFPK